MIVKGVPAASSAVFHTHLNEGWLLVLAGFVSRRVRAKTALFFYFPADCVPLNKHIKDKMKKLTYVFIVIGIMAVSCKGTAKKTNDEASLVKQFEITEVWRTDTLLMTPESVIYDKKRDIFYVSNLNFEPRKKDGNGFISRIDKNGNITDLRWIEGLSSPKGLAIVGDTLYTADVDEIVAIDITSSKIIRRMTIDGGKMLNDITSDPEGNLYFSDSDANRIYFFSKNNITVWYEEQLNGPNGLLWDGERLLVASMGGMDFAAIDIRTKTRQLITEGVNRGDGIAWTGIPGYYIVTDWEGEIFMINPDFTRISLINSKSEKINTADIEYLTGMNLLLVPTFFKNCIIAYKLTEKKAM